MADQWASTEEHAPGGGWATTDEHAPADTSKGFWGSVSDAGKAFWEGIGGQQVMDMLGGASRDPARAQKAKETFQGVVQGLANEPSRVWEELKQSGAAMTRGDVPGAAQHMGGAVPILGAPAEQVAQDVGEGHYARGVGHGVALLAPFVAPELLPAQLKAKVGVKPRLNPVEQEAVAFGQREGIPLPLSVQTGGKFARGMEALTESDLGGSRYAADARDATAAGLTRTGEDLAQRTAPGGPVSVEQAGRGVIDSLKKDIQVKKGLADQSYRQVWDLEKDPANVREVTMGLDAEGNPLTEKMALPVDMSPLKAQLAPILERYVYANPISVQRASQGLKALQNVVEGPRWKPASVAELDLGALKEAARAELPELRDMSQGLAASAVKDLSNQIDAAVSQAKLPGNVTPPAGAMHPGLQALREGRDLTRQKWETSDVLTSFGRKIEDLEPVQVAGQLTWGRDTGIERLREVASRAPQELPKVGRSLVEGLLEKATAGGDFTQTRSILGKWRDLGPETKKLLFRNPLLIKDLDNFFQLAEQAAVNPNPSGTALVTKAGTHVATMLTGVGLVVTGHPGLGGAAFATEGLHLIGNAALARMLFSPGGARALAQGMQVTWNNPLKATATAAKIMKLAGPSLQVQPSAAQQDFLDRARKASGQ